MVHRIIFVFYVKDSTLQKVFAQAWSDRVIVRCLKIQNVKAKSVWAVKKINGIRYEVYFFS